MNRASFLYANLLAVAFFIVTMAGIAASYSTVTNVPIADVIDSVFDFGWFGCVMIVVGIVVHELLHGVGFVVFGGARWSDLKLGVMWKFLTPYATCGAPLSVSAYRWTCALPGIMLGLVPVLLGIATRSLDVAAFGALFLGGAGGDALAIWRTRDLPSNTRVRDSATTLGCELVLEIEAAAQG